MRRHNLASILRIVHMSGPTSRSELTTLTGLNRSTVGALTSELVEAGLVRAEEPVGRGVGRPSIVVAPVTTRVHVVAVDLGVERVGVALIGLGGAIVARGALGHSPGEDHTALLARVFGLVSTLRGECDVSSDCVGVGVGVPGVVRHADGLVQAAPNLGWAEVPLGSVLAELVGDGLPVAVANDADLAAIAEHARGAARGLSHVVMVSGDVGVGGGIIVDGRLMTGAGGYGGEIGHIVVNPEGRVCRCGLTGCWETTVGEQAVREALGCRADQRVRDVLLTLDPGDERLDEVGRWLGIGVANLVNICNPQSVLFGGMFGDLFPLVRESVASHLGRSLVAPLDGLELSTADLGSNSVVVGAAELAFARLLDDPLGHLARSAATRVA